jgi:glycosyltransferase involved in cell wall biosynthesis
MISLIIPTLNEEEYLPKLLESIKCQSFKDYEIIVADAKSKDNTREIARKYGCIVTEGGMPGAGRNKGASVAKGDFLFFFDADVKLPKNFMKQAYEEISEKYLDLATCDIKPLSNMKIDKVLHKFASLYIKVGQYIDPHAPGFCILVSKRLFKRVNGFDETLTLGEDHEFVKRASRFSRLRILESTYIYVSVRRLTKEGRLNLIKKYFEVEMHRQFKGEVKREVVGYEFGDFNHKTEEKSLKKFEKRLLTLEREYNKLMNSRKKIINKIEKEYYQKLKKRLVNLIWRTK